MEKPVAAELELKFFFKPGFTGALKVFDFFPMN
jgi:hypothetical protein